MKKTTEIGDAEIAQIAEALTRLRKKAGYTSYENFAIENGFGRKQYWRMEKGANLTVKMLMRVLKVHGLSLKEFAKTLSE